MLRTISKLGLPWQNAMRISLRYLSGEIIDFPNMGPPVPDYPDKNDESTDIKRARLLYQSRKRGISENGLLLSNFAGRYLKNFNKDQLKEFDALLNKPSNDWDLYYWILGKEETPQEFDNDVMKLLKEYCKNDEMEERYQQPHLEE